LAVLSPISFRKEMGRRAGTKKQRNVFMRFNREYCKIPSRQGRKNKTKEKTQ
jgi:hypothetical protein